MNRNDVNWHGSFAVIVTPFKRDGSVDEAGYRRIIDFIIESGCHGVITAGSTGEFFLMEPEERKRVFEICVDQTAGRVPVLACPAAIRTEDVEDYTRAAKKAGCDGVMVLPPIYVKITDREIVEFYKRVAGEGEMPLMLYNSPFAVNVYLTPKLIEDLVKIDEVVAIKDSSFDMLQFSNLVRSVRDEIRLFIGLGHM
ncbi:MAG: dihydrodipicolinate synthase family protein, partial [Rhodospirillaceae bacterium]|nr:dihydrodipicolinate synthase family protein [Rhodospirillaceae bacterium]